MLIRSGCVFIYEENASGIKRWTDGVTWSPSRILGNFLVYRELDKPFPPGEKKRAMKKNSRARPSRPGEPYTRPDGNNSAYSPTAPAAASFSSDRAPNEMERSLIGSLVDSYGFKADGLVKKTMSVTVQGVTHHLVSYYSVSDVVNGQLRTPSQTESLNYVRPRPELTSKQSFRSPLEEMEDIEGIREHSMAVQAPYGYRPPQMASHPGYLPPSAPYYSSGLYSGGQNPPATTAGYPPGTTAIAGGYIPAPMPTSQMAPRGEEYGQYPAPAFSRPYEPLNSGLTSNPHGANMLPTSASPTASSLHVRNSQHHPSLYPQAGQQTRPVPNQSPIESRTASSYARSSFSLPTNTSQPPANADNPHLMQPSSVVKHETREANHAANVATAPGPSPAYAHERQPYFMNSNNVPLAQGTYHSGATIPSWPAPTATHQHI